MVVVSTGATDGVSSYGDARVTNGMSPSAQGLAVFSSVCCRLNEIVL